LLNSNLIFPFSEIEVNSFEFVDVPDSSFTPQEDDDTTTIDTITQLDHSQSSSSKLTPSWLGNLRPNIQFYDPEIVNYFINKFIQNITPMMPTFQDFGNTLDTLPDLILAMAAVGGLYCPVEGSFRISLALHTDARRLAMSRVSK
jgi:hypothetical protein